MILHMYTLPKLKSVEFITSTSARSKRNLSIDDTIRNTTIVSVNWTRLSLHAVNLKAEGFEKYSVQSRRYKGMKNSIVL